jgi:hypothetical protein
MIAAREALLLYQRLRNEACANAARAAAWAAAVATALAQGVAHLLVIAKQAAALQAKGKAERPGICGVQVGESLTTL